MLRKLWHWLKQIWGWIVGRRSGGAPQPRALSDQGYQREFCRLLGQVDEHWDRGKWESWLRDSRIHPSECLRILDHLPQRLVRHQEVSSEGIGEALLGL